MHELLLVLACFAMLVAWGAPAALLLPRGLGLAAAPALGAATLATMCAAVVYADVPVRNAVPFAWAALAVAVAALWFIGRRRHRDATREARLGVWFACACLAITVAWLGWPYVTAGSEHYFAYVNPDGWSYVDTADFLKDHPRCDILGAHQRPPLAPTDPAAIGTWHDGPVDRNALFLHPWLVNVAPTVEQRVGQYGLLAFVTVTLGSRDSFQAMIPLTLALVASSGAGVLLLLLAAGARRRIALAGGLLWQLSPIVAFSFFIQFFSQQVGLLLAPLCGALACRAIQSGDARSLVLLTLAWGGLWAAYPEITPFVALFTLLLVSLTWPRGSWRSHRRMVPEDDRDECSDHREQHEHHPRRIPLRIATLLLPPLVGLLLEHRGAIATYHFLLSQIQQPPGTVRAGEGVFPFGTTALLLPFWMGLTHELLLLTSRVTLQWIVLITSLICLPAIVAGWRSCWALAPTLLLFALTALALWFKLAVLERYGYGATKLAMFTAWLVPLAWAGLLQRMTLARRTWFRSYLRAVLVVLPLSFLFLDLQLATASLPGSLSRMMHPEFGRGEALSSLRTLFPDAQSERDAEQQGVMLDLRNWSDMLWATYWLRDLRLGIWRAQPAYLSRDMLAEVDHARFHLRDFHERWLLADLDIHDVIDRSLRQPIRRTARFGLFPFAGFIDFDHATLDGYPHPRLGAPEPDGAGELQRLVWKGVRLRSVRPGPGSHRLGCMVTPLRGPLDLQLELDGRTVQTFHVPDRRSLVSSDLGLAPDSVHIIELQVAGAAEREPSSPADFAIARVRLAAD